MVKAKNSDILSLDKGQQKTVVKQTKTLTKNIKDGKITITKQKPKTTLAESRGLVYIAHIPHGFYEEPMRNYFKQFGVITNVKVCRSRKNGNSKGYGYVEFLHPEVAKVAADTMNNYIMFKKRLVAEYVPYEKRPKGLFRGRSSNPTRYSTKVRREKQIKANLSVDTKTHLRRSKTRLSKINKKMQKLNDAGVDSQLEIADLPDQIKQEKQSEEVTHIVDPYDSDIEVKIPKARKSEQLVKKRGDSVLNVAITKKKSKKCGIPLLNVAITKKKSNKKKDVKKK